MKYIVLALLGLVFGSFITMLSYRFIERDSYAGRSKCPMCGHKLATLDLIPVLSWLLLNGKCRYCKGKISIRYPMIEILTTAAFLGIASNSSDLFIILLLVMMTIALVTITVIDLEYMIIPDELQISLAAIGATYAFYMDVPLFWVIAKFFTCLLIALILKYGFLLFSKRDGLGWGDVKFFAVAGIYLHLEALSAFFMISGFAGILTALFWRKLTKQEKFPFGPALALSLYLCIVYPKIASIFTIAA